MRMDDRAPSCKAVLAQPDQDAAVTTDREHLAGMSCAGAEIRGSRLGEHDRRFPRLSDQARQNVTPVGKQDIAAFSSGPHADEEHHARRVGHSSTLGVCLQVAASEAGKTGAVSVPARVLDGRKSVGVTVRMRRDVHQLVGEVEYRAAAHEARDGHQSGLMQAGDARVNGVSCPNVDVFGLNERRRASGCSVHRGAPSQ